MSEDEKRSRAREHLGALLSEVVGSSSFNAEALRGRTAYYDKSADASITEQLSFASAAKALVELPGFSERYGDDASERLTIQFSYAVLSALSDDTTIEDAVEKTWRSLTRELGDPDWHYVSLANLTNFAADFVSLEVAPGVSIRHRVVDKLRHDLGGVNGRSTSSIKIGRPISLQVRTYSTSKRTCRNRRIISFWAAPELVMR